MKIATLWLLMVSVAALHAHEGGCGGRMGGVFGCFGNAPGKMYESPRLEQDFYFGGFRLKTPRRDFHVYVYKNEGNALAELVGKDVAFKVFKIPGKNPSLEAAVKKCAPKNLSVIKSYPIRSSGGLNGFKTVYGNAPGKYVPLAMCYVYPMRDGGFACFRAVPTCKYPNWADANRLVTGNLRYAKVK